MPKCTNEANGVPGKQPSWSRGLRAGIRSHRAMKDKTATPIPKVDRFLTWEGGGTQAPRFG